ncbi:hypothetical protein V5O48_012377 [Marasmius crinis-equi]|uniref:Uncharacterized protein n=1 Tax=Marasmius crinis-equi TaxID=585013 RepID=A0ABR3F2Y7_9AGAR
MEIITLKINLSPVSDLLSLTLIKNEDFDDYPDSSCTVGPTIVPAPQPSGVWKGRPPTFIYHYLLHLFVRVYRGMLSPIPVHCTTDDGFSQLTTSRASAFLRIASKLRQDDQAMLTRRVDPTLYQSHHLCRYQYRRVSRYRPRAVYPQSHLTRASTFGNPALALNGCGFAACSEPRRYRLQQHYVSLSDLRSSC